MAGRPRVDLDLKVIKAMAAVGATDEEIADHLGAAVTTLRRRGKEALREGRSSLAIRLRRKQVEMALAGNVPLLIRLGAVYMNQRATEEVSVPELRDGLKVTVKHVIVDPKRPAPNVR